MTVRRTQGRKGVAQRQHPESWRKRGQTAEIQDFEFRRTIGLQLGQLDYS